MFSNFSARERLFIFSGFGFIIFLLVLVTLKKVVNIKNQYSNLVENNQKSLVQMNGIVNDFLVYKDLEHISKVSISQIYARLDELFVKYDLKNNVSNLKDTTTTSLKIYNKFSISIDFNSIYLDDLFQLIYEIEKNRYIKGQVEYLSFQKPFASKDTYDAKLTLSVYSKKN